MGKVRIRRRFTPVWPQLVGIDAARGDVIKLLKESNKALLEANSRQVGGNHYKTNGKGEEHWDRVARLGLNYWEASTTKYVERARLKNGLQDLKKARHFLDKLIELVEAGVLKGYSGTSSYKFRRPRI